MAVTATSRLGKYVCKVDYLDIRHIIVYKKSTQVYICHGKHHISGPFNSIEQAKIEATQLISQGVKYDKHKK
tara:strand:- start:91 stop:306 length:216 start_codon:yes stop_codon:yes gene_type:complete